MVASTPDALRTSPWRSRWESWRHPAAAALSRLGPYSGWIATALYVAASLLIFRSPVAHLGSVCACNGSSDPSQSLWAFVWFPHALLHGLDPLHTSLIWVPFGINLAGTVSTPLAALAAAPITWLFGPIVAYNVVVLAAPVAAAWCAYRLCLYVTRAAWPSVLAGYTYGFSTYEIGQLLGHLQALIVFCPPLVVLLVVKLLDGALSRRRFVIQLAVVLVVQLLLSTEILLTMTCMGLAALAAAWVLGPDKLRSRIISALVPIALAYALMAVLCSWFIYEAMRAPNFVNVGPLYPTDLLAYVIPTVMTRIGGGHFASTSSSFRAGLGETGAYLGFAAGRDRLVLSLDRLEGAEREGDRGRARGQRCVVAR
ncbi:MAG: hypothetical protein ACLP8S_29540 [Solirubrobacteraceae bacterium]